MPNMGKPGAGRVRIPHPGWLLATILALAAATLAVLVLGDSADHGINTALSSLEKSALALGAAFCLLGLLWRYRNSLQANSPRGIEIVSDRSTTSQDVIAELREKLSSLELSSPSTVPGEASPQSFLTDISTVVKTATTPMGWVAAGLLTLRPRAVYRVHCVCREDASSPEPKGLTVEVSTKVGSDSTVATVWAQDWDGVASRAACVVAAFVLPRCKLSKRAPWIPWRGRDLDPQLFYHFIEARRLASQGRSEEALEHFVTAQALDPLNPYIRIERATVLDELALYIDALAIYVDVVTLESWYDRKLWKRYRGLMRDNYRGQSAHGMLRRSPHGPAALLLARYRMIGSLAASQRIAEQWKRHCGRRASDPRFAHPRHRDAMSALQRLRPILGAYGLEMMGAEQRDKLPPGDFGYREIEVSASAIRRVLQYAALMETVALERDYRLSKPRRWRRQLGITQRSVRILPIWAWLHFRYVETLQLGDSFGATGIPYADLPRPAGDIFKSRLRRSQWVLYKWPPPLDLILRKVRRAQRWHPWSRPGWQEHYNAACTYALGLVTPELRTSMNLQITPGIAEDHLMYVGHAIDSLERAVLAPDSRLENGISPWLVRGDQDLNDLRITRPFATFLERYLAEDLAVPPLPTNLAILTLSAHMVRLVERYASLREADWLGPDAIRSIDLKQELEWWQTLRQYTLQYKDWATRRRLIILGQSGLRHAPFDSVIPRLDPDIRVPQPNHRKSSGSKTSQKTDQVTRVQSLLDISADLDAKAREMIGRRNRVLDKLYELIPWRQLEKALTEASTSWGAYRDSQLSMKIAMQLANTWKRIGMLAKSLRETQAPAKADNHADDLLVEILQLVRLLSDLPVKVPKSPSPSELVGCPQEQR